MDGGEGEKVKWRKENISFSSSDEKQEQERDSFVTVRPRGKEKLWESQFTRRKLLLLNVTSVIGLFCIDWLSAISALFCGSALSAVQNTLQGYSFFPQVSFAYNDNVK